MNQDDFAITPRNLGGITLKKYCPHCFWYLLRLRFHPPFGSFGAAIFRSLQDIQEAVVGHFLGKDGCLPKEFSPFCDCCGRADFPRHWSKFKYQHPSGVYLYGSPDEIFALSNGHLCVIDHKSARNKGKDDPFHSQYHVQVVGYGDIAENGLELGVVDSAGLLYWEIQADAVTKAPADHYSKGVLTVPFVPKPLEVEVDYSMLDPLLKEALKLWNAKTPPDAVEGCPDCKKLNLLFAIEQEIEGHDRDLLHRFGMYQDIRNELIVRSYGRLKLRLESLDELYRSGDAMFAPDRLAANWEFFDPNSPTGLVMRD